MIINDSRAKFEIYIYIYYYRGLDSRILYSNLTPYKLIEKYQRIVCPRFNRSISFIPLFQSHPLQRIVVIYL